MTRKLTSQDKSALSIAVELLNRTQGRGLFELDYLERRVDKKNCFVVAAFNELQLIGIGVAEILDNADFYRPFDDSLPSELAGKIIGSFTTLSVHENYQGKGIGSLLSRKRLEWLIEYRCEVVLGVSWVSGFKGTSDRTFESVGFKPIKRSKDFYGLYSLKKPFDCPACHRIPCTCEAILYRKDFSK